MNIFSSRSKSIKIREWSEFITEKVVMISGKYQVQIWGPPPPSFLEEKRSPSPSNFGYTFSDPTPIPSQNRKKKLKIT